MKVNQWLATISASVYSQPKRISNSRNETYDRGETREYSESKKIIECSSPDRK